MKQERKKVGSRIGSGIGNGIGSGMGREKRNFSLPLPVVF